MPGAIKTVNIPVSVEPYDIVLDMTFQKGNDRGIDFGNVRVNQEAKQLCTLKNKGKREIKYKYVHEKWILQAEREITNE